jgi:acetyltransferase-like isoleucine patch superfamily enzyme
MEIVLATNGLVGIGGSETYLFSVAEHLQRLGHDVPVHAAGAWLGAGAVVGDHSLIREGARLETAAMVGHGGVIEEDVLCGPGLSVTTDNTMGRGHGIELPFVTLRRACRVGANVALMTGIEIGEEAVVGAGSVVTRDVAARTVVFGVPARFVRDVTEAELREHHPPRTGAAR